MYQDDANQTVVQVGEHIAKQMQNIGLILNTLNTSPRILIIIAFKRVASVVNISVKCLVHFFNLRDEIFKIQ